MTVSDADEVIVAGNLLPVQTATNCPPLGLKLDGMFVELRCIDRDSALLGGEFFELQGFSSQISYDADLKGNYNIIKDLIYSFGVN